MTHARSAAPFGRLLDIRPGEGRAVIRSGAYFFLVLFGYFLIRPVREAMGVQRSMDDLRWLFVATCGASLVATLAFGTLVSRTDRSRFIPIATRAIIACLIGFGVVTLSTGGHPGVRVGYGFYVWLSIVNLFMTSVFWAFMADIWTLEQGKRLFPAIAVGGTLGALAGSLCAWQLAEALGAAGQMLLAAAVFEGSVWAMRSVRTGAGATGRGARSEPREPPIGGRWWDGAAAMLASPYLLGIGCWITMMAVSNTLIYFAGARLISNASEELGARVALFAQLDLWTQVATLLAQLFVTGRLMRWVGVGVTLAVLPIVTAGGFGVLAWASGVEGVEPWRVYAVFVAFNAMHRATRYAIARPARETLFSVIPASEKYKAKPIVDVFLYRGGDVAGAAVDTRLAVSGKLIGTVAVYAAQLALVWGALSMWLAWCQRRRARAGNGSSSFERAATSAGQGPGGVRA